MINGNEWSRCNLVSMVADVILLREVVRGILMAVVVLFSLELEARVYGLLT